MIIRNLDSNNDWTFGQSLVNYLRDDNAIMLNIKTRLLEWYGDCFFAQKNGIDWYNRLDKGQKLKLDLEIKQIILDSYGVVNINSYSSTLTDRKYSIQFNITTIFSESVQDSLEV